MSELNQLINSAEEIMKDGGSPEKTLKGLLTDLKAYANSLEDKWIPVSERLPKCDEYILLSFENYSLPAIGRYEEDENGGAFYEGDEDRSLVSYELFVNAWQPLPEPWIG